MNKKEVLRISIIVVISIVVVFLAGTEYQAYKVRSALSEISKAFTTEPQQKKEEGAPVLIEKKIGEEIELATLKYKVTKSEERQTISSKYGTPKVASEGAKFVVVSLELTNITDTPYNFSNYDGFIIIDNKGRRFSEYENVFTSIDNYLAQRKLSPSIAEKGVFVYEIPIDAISYKLSIGKGGTNDYYQVTLK